MVGEAYLTTWGAITLQGPHQVAKQSRTRVPFSPRADSQSALLLRCVSICSLCARIEGRGETYEAKLWTPCLDIAVAEKARGWLSCLVMGCWYCARARKLVVAVAGLMRVLVSSARLKMVRVADIYVVGWVYIWKGKIRGEVAQVREG